MSDRSSPHRVFVVGDNAGWENLGCCGEPAPTRRIDVLAGEGLRSTTPTRLLPYITRRAGHAPLHPEAPSR